ncbi:lipopolysaccharide biosynthesis protein [Plebeiibacterium sediminum]|uniref:Polysaccharide biosynthesis C-terminal domain-containing protein n=1 Tax=Plebeiibacterium sediminum TaxID=2992112 RepID=A0AAE3M1L0_9BACT|nr:polysaccharide biosynthesis C-terminal domain-containing protein [Plebeiobacterium sediminum]MCW3785172.1 polysaccharide biosynthesis C-terminal domain-containing protein [Plebeiobacterium sediminum]
MGSLKSLAGETVVYGGGTILVRLLNWLLMPYYIRTMSNIQYGYITEIYGYIAIFLVVLTYGFETTFFRFSKNDNYKGVFTTGFLSILTTSSVFIVFLFFLLKNIKLSDQLESYNELIWLAGLIVAFDAVSALIFAKLRYLGKSIRFAIIKLLNVLILIFFNIFFLLVCPYLLKNYTESVFSNLVNSFYRDNQEAYYVLFSNLIASVFILIILLKDIKGVIKGFDFSLLKRMYKYSFPILIVGITGMINQSIDKALLPRLIGGDEGYKMVALYGANFKIGVLMAMFTQSFRMAFEPFFFKHSQSSQDNSIYSTILNYFVLFGLLIFIGVTFFMDIINLILVPEYTKANGVIPLVLIAQLLSGIYFTLSVWYKVSDKTIYGAYMGVIGTTVTLLSNLILIPIIGYYGCAISGLLCFASMVVFSIIWGNKYYKIDYDWLRILKYVVFTALLYFLGIYIIPYIFHVITPLTGPLYNIALFLLRFGLIVVFLWTIYVLEFKKLIKIKNVSTN